MPPDVLALPTFPYCSALYTGYVSDPTPKTSPMGDVIDIPVDTFYYFKVSLFAISWLIFELGAAQFLQFFSDVSIFYGVRLLCR